MRHSDLLVMSYLKHGSANYYKHEQDGGIPNWAFSAVTVFNLLE